MADEQLRNWIKESLSRGYSADYLKDYLLKQGYAEPEIEEAINPVRSAEAILPVQKAIPEKPKNRKWIWIVIAIAAIAALIILVVILYLVLSGSQPLSAPPLTSAQMPIVQVNPITVSVPDNYSFTVLTSRTIRGKDSESGIITRMELDSNSSGMMDLKNDVSYKKSKSVMRWTKDSENHFMEIESERYVIGDTIYYRIIGARNESGDIPDAPTEWTKTSAEELKKQFTTMDFLDLLEGSLQLKDQLEIINRSKSVIVSKAERHFRLLADKDMTALVFGRMFINPFYDVKQKSQAFDQEAMAKSEKNMNVENLSRLLKDMNVDYWTDADGRVIRANFNVAFDDTSEEHVNDIFSGDSTFISTTISGYDRQGSIIVPQEALNAPSAESF